VQHTGFAGCWTESREAQARKELQRLKAAWIDSIPESLTLPSITEGSATEPLCDSVLLSAGGRTLTSVIELDLTDSSGPLHSTTILSGSGPVMATRDRLFLTEPGERGYRIHHFVLGDGSRRGRYVGSGSVAGSILSQWALDADEGHLRVASTGNGNSVSVLRLAENGPLEPVGEVTQLAPTEDLRAVRFVGSRGYVVTFRKTDPLFVLDLSEPAAPAVRGELEIPGFSTYIHPLDERHLLTIGYDADDQGAFAWFQGIRLQIFDVTVPSAPTLLHKAVIGTRGSSSEAATNPLAFNYSHQRGLLALPMTICEGGEGGTYGTQMTFSGLLVYRATVVGGFSSLGGIPHPAGNGSVTCQNWWTRANSVVKRSVFIDDLVWSFSSQQARAARIDDLTHPVAIVDLTAAEQRDASPARP
jgi:hypothetical protein